jgi:choice-of-anchor A domain-containing protein
VINFPRCATVAAGLVLSVSAVSAAHAATTYDYDVVAFGNFTSANTEVNGALAVGGNTTVSSFSVGKDLGAAYNGTSLAVGGNLTYNNGSVFRGDVVAGGNISSPGPTVNNGTKTANGVVPLDFAAELVRMKGVSSLIAGLDTNGTITSSGGLKLTGTDSVLNVFSINASDLQVGSGLSVVIPNGSVAVINVAGTSFASTYAGSFTINGQTIANNSAGLASSLLFNFTDATSLTFLGSWGGNVLAPTANVQLANGGFFGSLVADNVTSTSEFYMGRFSGYDRLQPPPAVPEPATWMMMIAGFGLIGGLMRRKTRQLSFA